MEVAKDETNHTVPLITRYRGWAVSQGIKLTYTESRSQESMEQHLYSSIPREAQLIMVHVHLNVNSRKQCISV